MPGTCTGCKQAVYFAEETWALDKIWHTTCLKCTACQKRLDSGSIVENDNNPYCKNCYSKEFGPKGYGFASGASGPMAGNYTKS